MLFTGEYEHTIDAKHRLAIPSEIRSRLDSRIHGDAFFLAPGANGHLWLWPEKTFETLGSRIEGRLIQPEAIMAFQEFIFPHSTRLELDSAGRVRLPERMLQQAGLGQTVMILGMRDHLELRDPAQWNANRQQMLGRQREIMLEALRILGPGATPSGPGMHDAP